jgi:small subunit ribosomal protein S9
MDDETRNEGFDPAHESPADASSDASPDEVTGDEVTEEPPTEAEADTSRDEVAEEDVAADTSPDAAAGGAAQDLGDEEDEGYEPAPRVKPEIPGADLEVDIVLEGTDPLARGGADWEEGEGGPAEEAGEEIVEQPIAAATIDLAAGARYRATGKRKTAVARVTLRPGTGEYAINGRTLNAFFPRQTLQRNIRQPLEAVGYEERMDVVVRIHGGGVSAQAGAVRHGISRALLEADPNLRGELKRRGFLTRDSRAKERKKAGLKKARKRPQFSKR